MDHKDNQTSPASTRKSRWSAVDTVILLLVLLALAGVVYRVVMAVREETAREKQTLYEVYFEVLETHEDTLAEIKGFDAVYLYENDARLGHVGVYKDLATDEYRVALTPNSVDGVTKPNHVTAIGCMISSGKTTADGSLFIQGSGRYLTPGSELQIRTDRVLLTVRITGIRTHS